MGLLPIIFEKKTFHTIPLNFLPVYISRYNLHCAIINLEIVSNLDIRRCLHASVLCLKMSEQQNTIIFQFEVTMKQRKNNRKIAFENEKIVYFFVWRNKDNVKSCCLKKIYLTYDKIMLFILLTITD